MRKLGMSSPIRIDEHQNIKVAEKDSKTSTLEENSMTIIHESSDNNMDEVVYHTDYHGATTHPTPTPKHPKP
ncbi:hypothetical protein PanWU01x14_318810 [Parasponia andersonii]|uniref:Uncharacterized protein n=1 Tax=Parasponia andersonii TaxID=3476 RepID=A0A2P5AM60_PARAD|nr:hypothetical protein PanWU01x14_318810 [Parasponia andersonii]